ncbi:uncharacterized protein LOC132755544 [Ruditapes philippinarum]|uniref:uncharacterized protein LOC132755544 n=1 Tax=Ruditapes philippinarum TaxID=129788 RepID=UPI00295A591D|nr:uncharacterized protein LOC132755544 [Ruditapes philippinarum]
MMFATNDQLQLLQRARKWYRDGTFRVVRKPFRQLWSIHAFLRKGETMKQVPLLFVMMSRRRKQDYIAVLEKLLDIMDEAPVVERFTMDFEAGLWQALRQIFPGASLKGCGFHWAQAIQRRVQELGLMTTYRHIEGVHQIIRKLLALPFLPGSDIPRAFKKLFDKVDVSSQALVDLFEYVNDQWLENSLWSAEEWSVYRQTVRTNNETEGWHRRLNSQAGRGVIPFYVLLTLLLQEAKLVNIHLQLVTEAGVGRYRREVNRNMDAKVMDLWDMYDAHDVVCEEFLLEIGSIYGNF